VKTSLWAPALGACYALLVSCSNPQPVPAPKAKLSTDDGGRHQYQLNISDGFGSAAYVEAFAIYTIANERSCTPKNFGGRLSNFEERLAVPVTLNGATDFVTSARDNPLRDEDYYGLGVCHWQLNSLHFDISFHRYSRIASVGSKQVANGGEVELLCLLDRNLGRLPCAEKSRVTDARRADYAAMTIRIRKE